MASYHVATVICCMQWNFLIPAVISVLSLSHQNTHPQFLHHLLCLELPPSSLVNKFEIFYSFYICFLQYCMTWGTWGDRSNSSFEDKHLHVTPISALYLLHDVGLFNFLRVCFLNCTMGSK